MSWEPVGAERMYMSDTTLEQALSRAKTAVVGCRCQIYTGLDECVCETEAAGAPDPSTEDWPEAVVTLARSLHEKTLPKRYGTELVEVTPWESLTVAQRTQKCRDAEQYLKRHGR